MCLLLLARNKRLAEYEDKTQHMLSEEFQLQIRQERNMEFTTTLYNNNYEIAGSFWIGQISCHHIPRLNFYDGAQSTHQIKCKVYEDMFGSFLNPSTQPTFVEQMNEEMWVPMGIMDAWETFNINSGNKLGQSGFQGSTPGIWTKLREGMLQPSPLLNLDW